MQHNGTFMRAEAGFIGCLTTLSFNFNAIVKVPAALGGGISPLPRSHPSARFGKD